MDKIIDLQKTVYEITRDYPEIIEILKELGFYDIVKPGMLQTAGRFMTLPKGAAMKKIELEHIRQVLEEKGFTVIEGGSL
jgi:threonyl-tRNA synthetase